MYVFPMASDALETLQCSPSVGKQELCISGMPSIKCSMNSNVSGADTHWPSFRYELSSIATVFLQTKNIALNMKITFWLYASLCVFIDLISRASQIWFHVLSALRKAHYFSTAVAPWHAGHKALASDACR